MIDQVKLNTQQISLVEACLILEDLEASNQLTSHSAGKFTYHKGRDAEHGEIVVVMSGGDDCLLIKAA